MIDHISQSQGSKEVTANTDFDALYPAAFYGQHARTTTALTWGYYGAVIFSPGDSPPLYVIPDGTIALTASATNYIEHVAGAAPTANTSGWTGGSIPDYVVITGTATITSITDWRCGAPVTAGGGGGSVPTGTGFRHVTSGAEDGTAVAVNLSGSDATGTLAAARMPALTGDVTTSSGAVATTIANDAVTNAKAANMANATIKGRTTSGTGDPEDLTASQAAAILGTNVKSTESIIVSASDESTALTTGTGKMTFRMPYAFTLTDIRASLSTAQTSGSIFTVDVNESGTTIISTKLTIDNTEKTTTTAATPAVISDSSLADDAEMTIDIDQVGDGTAKGLKVTLIGHR